MQELPIDEVVADRERRFGGVTRLLGSAAARRLATARACVVGIGGVGSWVAEALARSGVGHLTLIDLDHVAQSNFNRQIHALEHTLGQAKVQAMRERILAIDPWARVEVVEDFLTPDNASVLLQGFDVVVDAIDNVRAKVAIVLACRRAGMPLVVTGAAGGKRDPRAIRVEDLARTEQDPLLARMRRMLRHEHGFPRRTGQRFGIETVYSIEPTSRPDSCAADRAPQGLACSGYGSSVVVTASVGMLAAARAMEQLLEGGGGPQARITEEIGHEA
jgi:tRNA A37 threonylcarbamoyladenosine dehydratase